MTSEKLIRGVNRNTATKMGEEQKSFLGGLEIEVI